MVTPSQDWVGKQVVALHDFWGPPAYENDMEAEYVKEGDLGVIKRVGIEGELYVNFHDKTVTSETPSYWVHGYLGEDFSPYG